MLLLTSLTVVTFALVTSMLASAQIQSVEHIGSCCVYSSLNGAKAIDDTLELSYVMTSTDKLVEISGKHEPDSYFACPPGVWHTLYKAAQNSELIVDRTSAGIFKNAYRKSPYGTLEIVSMADGGQSAVALVFYGRKNRTLLIVMSQVQAYVLANMIHESEN